MKFTVAYIFLFVYVVAAIVFWGYSLTRQGNLIAELEKEKVKIQYQHDPNISLYNELKNIEDKKQRRRQQYWGEGSIFIIIIVLAAGVVYVSYYKQRKLAKLQKNFMLSITHELKTPIAGIKLNLQTIQKRKLDETTHSKLIESSVIETNRLNDLCNNILTATQLENTKEVIDTDSISLEQLIQEVIAEKKLRYPDLFIKTNLSQTNKTIGGDPFLWKLVFSNLIENAKKYSQKHTPIVVELLESDKNQFKILVKDFGCGISDEEKKKIFEKFYRIGNENTRTSKGTGLGLYIVKKIVTLYGGEIFVHKNQPQGSIFEIII